MLFRSLRKHKNLFEKSFLIASRVMAFKIPIKSFRFTIPLTFSCNRNPLSLCRKYYTSAVHWRRTRKMKWFMLHAVVQDSQSPLCHLRYKMQIERELHTRRRKQPIRSLIHFMACQRLPRYNSAYVQSTNACML